MIRILIADDEDLLRGSLAALLSLEEDLTIVAEASTSTDAVRLAREHRPNIALLDLEMPPADGLRAAEEIRAELPTQIVLVTRHARPGVLRRALSAGVSGFVPQDHFRGQAGGDHPRRRRGTAVCRPGHRRVRADGGRLPLTDRETGRAAGIADRSVDQRDRRAGPPRAGTGLQLLIVGHGQAGRQLSPTTSTQVV